MLTPEEERLFNEKYDKLVVYAPEKVRRILETQREGYKSLVASLTEMYNHFPFCSYKKSQK